LLKEVISRVKGQTMPMRSPGVPGTKLSSCLSSMRLRTVRVLSIASIYHLLPHNINVFPGLSSAKAWDQRTKRVKRSGARQGVDRIAIVVAGGQGVLDLQADLIADGGAEVCVVAYP